MNTVIFKFKDVEDLKLEYDNVIKVWHIVENSNKKKYSLASSDHLIGFLRFFYQEPKDALSQIKTEIANNDIYEDALKKMPIKNAIVFCIVNKLFFWLELAEKWYKYIDIDDEFRALVRKIYSDKNYPQKVRHNLMALINQLPLEQG